MADACVCLAAEKAAYDEWARGVRREEARRIREEERKVKKERMAAKKAQSYSTLFTDEAMEAASEELEGVSASRDATAAMAYEEDFM